MSEPFVSITSRGCRNHPNMQATWGDLCPDCYTRCAGSNVMIGRTGVGYEPAATFPCPACGQDVGVYTDFHNVRLVQHMMFST